MKRYFYIILIVTAFSSIMAAKAQSDINMTTHWYNRANYNPASIAKVNYAYFFSNYRQQWIGVDGAPAVFNIQASEYIHKYRSAVGFSMVADKLGVTRAYNPMLTYAYRLAKSKSWSVSMGLSAGVFSRILDGTKFEAETGTDQYITYERESTISPDFNAGIEFQSAHFIVGLSSTHLSAIARSNTGFMNTNHRYGYVIYKNTNLKSINYNLGTQVVNRHNLTILEMNANIRFKKSTGLMDGAKEIFDIGFSYRTSRQMALLAGINILPNARISYVYEQSFSSGYFRNNTHEVAIEWRFLNKAASDHNPCDNEFWYH
jgi:type IX secretion system PorP/SprF family membrane protein